MNMKRTAHFLMSVTALIGLGGLAGCTSDKPKTVPVETTVETSAATPTNPTTTPAVAAGSTETQVSTEHTIRTVNVHGVGKTSQAPDQVTVTMGVETLGATAAEALKANNEKATELIKVLKDRGVEDKHLQTSSLSIYPQYDTTGRRITGYTVSNTVTATMTDIKGAGALIDAAAGVAGDAIRVQGLSFSLSDSADALKIARERAVADGRTQAEQFATAAGVKLGILRTISTVSVNVPVPVFRQAKLASAADASSVPIEAGSQEVSADVDLVYEIAD